MHPRSDKRNIITIQRTNNMRLFKQVIFLQLDATQSSILIRQVVCRLSFGLSVTLRYRDHVLEYFNNIVLS